MICDDVKEYEKVEHETLNPQKLESIGILAGGVAHDFNNILTIIMGNVSLARSLLTSGGAIDEKLREAEKACIRAKELTQQLLAFSNGGDPVKRVVHLESVIVNAVCLSLSGFAIDRRFAFAEDLFAVEADERQIGQVIGLIIGNAREAMPSGGTVDVSAENVTVNHKDEFPPAGKTYVKISISDTGRGIPKTHQPHMFDPCFTTKDGGTQKAMGLGPAICYSIVRKHNGFLDADSIEGIGTKFSIYLPALEKDRIPV